MVEIVQHELRLHANPSRVVVRPFHLAWQASGPDLDRVQKLARQVTALDPRTIRQELAGVLHEFADRHWHMEHVFETRFDEIEPKLGLDGLALKPDAKKLLGAYFCHEYSYAAAALMNPSVVRHPDQSGLQPGSTRILMSLRAVGEGHISTICFSEGIINTRRGLILQEPPHIATAAKPRDRYDPGTDGPVSVRRRADSSISGTVIFPVTEAQRNGLEDLRLVEFDDGSGKPLWIGTYTAYSGREIRSEMLRTRDFRRFELIPMTGSAARNKGMALFPRKIGGRYMMIGRQDGKNLYLLQSDEILNWDEGTLLLEPRFPWEFIQIGNCGAPIEVDQGWLLLTHGVGAMRKYAIGAVLLDKENPAKVLGRTAQPILSAADEDREGYVPNVVYTCGAIRTDGDLFIPYGVADSSVCFAFAPIDQILAAMV